MSAAPEPSNTNLPNARRQAERFAPFASALSADQVRVARIDPQLVAHNVAVGVAALDARRAEVGVLPGISLDEIDALSDMSVGLIYRCGQCERYEPVTGEVRALVLRASKARGSALLKADVLVAAGIVPASVVVGIRRGHGFVDLAGDCISLSSLCREYMGKLDGHVKITKAEVRELNDSGVALMAALRPSGAPRQPSKELQVATELRDRLWTLLELTWTQHVWRPGAWLFGREVAQYVPPLSSRAVRRRPSKPAPVPAPTPAPSPITES